MIPLRAALLAAALLAAGAATAAAGPRALNPTDGRPDAVVDLGTREGATLVKGQWRYSDARIMDADFRAVGADLRPSGPPVNTYDYAPHAGASEFDDSEWAAIDASTLQARRGSGRLSLNWYRITVTIPDRIGALFREFFANVSPQPAPPIVGRLPLMTRASLTTRA